MIWKKEFSNLKTNMTEDCALLIVGKEKDSPGKSML